MDTCLTLNDKRIWNVVVNKKKQLEQEVLLKDSIIKIQQVQKESFIRQLEQKDIQISHTKQLVQACELEVKQCTKEKNKYKRMFYISTAVAVIEGILIITLIIKQ
jgi:hypothetical protein